MSTIDWLRLERGIYQHRSSDRLKVRIHAPKPAERTLPPGSSLDDARHHLASLQRELRIQASACAATSTPTSNEHLLKNYAKRWLAEKRDRLRASTRTTYIEALSHILPRIGHLVCTGIVRADAQALVNALEEATQPDGSLYASDTVRGWWRVAKQLLRDMAADVGIDDPCRRVQPPRRRPGGRQRETRTLTAAELRSLLEAARHLQPLRFAEVATLACAGVRRGELYALRPEDIDYDQHVIQVRHSLARGELNTTKTGEPRDVVVPAFVTQAIREHRKRLMEEGHPGLELGVVFPSSTGTYCDGSNLCNVLQRIAVYAGIDKHLTPQVLRRTYNTLSIEAGTDRVVLRAMIGHASEQMTERYAGVGFGMKAVAAASFEQLVFGSR